MYIKNLHIKNLRGIKELNLDINQHGALIYGVNGSGKSTITDAVKLIISPLLSITLILSSIKTSDRFSINSSDLRFDSSIADINAIMILDNSEYEAHMSVSKYNDNFSQKNKALNAKLDEIIKNDNAILPIFVAYDVSRAISSDDIQLEANDNHSAGRTSAYDGVTTGSDFKLFFNWFRNQEDHEFQIRATEDQEYRDIQLESVRNAIHGILPGFDGIMVERRPELRMIIYKEGVKLAIDQLSDGERCYIAMIGDIARRMAIANPQSKNPLQCTGIVVIDEIELHLHPDWQRKAVPSLRRIFPNIQFIITTHSPQVLGEVNDMTMVKLIASENGVQAELNNSTFGRDSSFILESFMNTPKRNVEVSAKIEKMYELIDDGDYDNAESIADELAIEVGSKDANVVKARVIIDRRR